MIFGSFTLIVALIISGIAAYYSIAGLTAIFSTAVVPIIIMGAALEIGKITAAVWLKLNWSRASVAYKLYLVPAVMVLMLLTSMGIFGFLSKAHSDQTLITGNSSAQIALFDEKIKIQRENIDTARRALTQLDSQVNERLSRGTTEQSVERAAQLRRQQTAERNKLLKDVETAQNEIQKLNEARAPLAAELRKVESEVGPIKYIAALIYGPNPDADILEKAVSWMIIFIVAVFDPLALVLILAAQQSINWSRSNKKDVTKNSEEANLIKQSDAINDSAEKKTVEKTSKPVESEFDISRHAYLNKPWVHFPSGLKPMVAAEQVQSSPLIVSEESNKPKSTTKKRSKKELSEKSVPQVIYHPIAQETALVISDESVEFTDNKDEVLINGIKIKKIAGDYYEVNDKKYSQNVFYSMWPDVAKKYDSIFNELPTTDIETNFGNQFPTNAEKGDLFVRTDSVPNKLYKYNGVKWIEVDKNKTDTYSYDDKYIQFLIDKLHSGEYELDQLSATEQDLVAAKLQK
jgi:hypothetical protein